MITSTQNPLIKELASLKEKKGRENTGLFLIEGVRFVEEALKAGAPVQQVLYASRLLDGDRGGALLQAVDAARIPAEEVSDKVLSFSSDTDNPQGIVAAVKIPKVGLGELQTEFLVVADGVQDPGNLGTIIRSALAAGTGGVICTQGTVDLYNPKTLRSTMGTVFTIPVVQGVSDVDLITWLKQRSIPLVAADISGAETYYRSKLVPPFALVIGNEGRGVSEYLLSNASRTVMIPLSGDAESLNAAVAASIILFEAARQAQIGE